MNLSVGIVGLPNAGKSTLFNALLKKQQALTASYPFATIEPNVGIVPVPDNRLEFLAKSVEKDTGIMPPIVPAVVKFVDIAGLVKGAAQGEGLGNKFLSHIREADLICHVIRFFNDENVTHVSGTIDPKRDREIVETELILADLQTLQKQPEVKGSKDKDELKRWKMIQILKEALNKGKRAIDVYSDEEDLDILKSLNLLTLKNILYVANFSESQIGKDDKNEILTPFTPHIRISAKIEEELASLPEIEQKQYLESLGFAKSGLDRLINKTYEMLGLISFLTVGEIEARAWTIKKGTSASKAAGVIHTDFEKNFIKADIISYKDYQEIDSWEKAKRLGRINTVSRDYVLTDGDVVEFKIGKG